MNNKSALRIGIVGGGISGAALALELCRHPHLEVQLFESAAAFGEIGAGVGFGPNALRAIEKLGLAESYNATTDTTPAPWQDVWFEWRNSGDANLIGSTIAPGVGQSTIHRADFIDLMAAHLPDGIALFNKHAVSVEQNSDGVCVHFSDGSEYCGDLLIAADGIKSSVRGHVLKGLGLPAADPQFTGTCAYRGLVDSEQLRQSYRAAGVDEHLVDVPQMYLGVDAHVLTFPVKQGRVINVVAFVSDRSAGNPVWPEGAPWVRESSQQEMLDDFSGWGDAVRLLLECIPEPTYWALHDLAELSCYVHGRVALIGDAAHATLPHLGAGAGQGLEDACFLAELLGDPQVLRTDLNELLAIYDTLRRPRASKVQRTSRKHGELYELRDPIAGDDEQALGETLATCFDWLWNHDLNADVTEARSRLGWKFLKHSA